MKIRIALLVLIGFQLAEPAHAEESRFASHRCRPVGTWIIDVSFPNTPTPISRSLEFKQMLTLHADRTLQETNTTLHPNSSPLTSPAGVPPAFGSDGFGTWKRMPGCRIQFSFLKFVYAGDPGMPPMEMENGGPPPEGIHIGFFKVSGIARIMGNMYVAEEMQVKSELIFGPDPFSDEAFRQDAGISSATGMRLFAHD